MRIELAREASELSTRARGAALTVKVMESCRGDAAGLVLDFAGVRYVSYSFAYEFLGAIIGHARYKKIASPMLVNVEPSLRETLLDCMPVEQRTEIRFVDAHDQPELVSR